GAWARDSDSGTRVRNRRGLAWQISPPRARAAPPSPAIRMPKPVTVPGERGASAPCFAPSTGGLTPPARHFAARDMPTALCYHESAGTWLASFLRRGSMTYCLGIMTHEGLVLASDSRTNAGYDQVNV